MQGAYLEGVLELLRGDISTAIVVYQRKPLLDHILNTLRKGKQGQAQPVLLCPVPGLVIRILFLAGFLCTLKTLRQERAPTE